MTNYFYDAVFATDEDGSSWDSPFNSLSSAASALSADDTLYLKESDGADDMLSISVKCSVLGGYSSELTGTDVSVCTGLTKLTSVSSFTVGSGAAESVISKLWLYGGRFECLPVDVTIQDCAVTNGVDDNGGGISSRGDIIITRCQFVNCSANIDGGAIYLAAGSTLTISDTLIFNNQCGVTNETSGYGRGGGIYTPFIKMDRCLVVGNRANDYLGLGDSGYGGGMYIDSNLSTGDFWIRNSVISKNEAMDSGAIRINRNVDIVNCTVIDNRAFGAASIYAGVKVGVSAPATLTNSILRGNTGVAASYQLSNWPAGSVEFCNVENLLSGGVDDSAQIGDGCIDIDPVYKETPLQFALSGESDETILRGGSTSVTLYSAVDYLGIDRDDIAPTMGAFEYVALTISETEPLTVDEIINNLTNLQDAEFWSTIDVSDIEIVDIDPVYWQQIDVTLDSVPVTIPIIWNTEASSGYASIVSKDGTIDKKGLRLSPGIDILDGLAVTELGKLYIVDMHKALLEPTKSGLGDQFVLCYLPRSAF